MSVSTSSSSSSSSSASSSSSIPRAAALSPSSAYELGLGYLKRRVNNDYPFKPGHCFVSSYEQSLKLDIDIQGSPCEVRYVICIPMTLASSSPVALVDSASPNLRLCFQSRRILSAVLTDDLVRSRAEERVDVLANFNFGVGGPPYHPRHFMLRAQFCPHESHSHLPSKQARSGDFEQPDVHLFSWAVHHEL